MWLLERLVPESAPNNLSLAFQSDGELNAFALSEALSILLRRHEVLRTVYFATGADLMKTVLAPDEFVVTFEDVEEFSPTPGQVEQALRPFVTRRFLFDGRPLVRAGLFHHPDGNVVCLAFHHLVYDVISATVILEELVAAYNCLATGEALPGYLLTPVATFVEPEPTAASLAFWRAQLEDFDPATLDLSFGIPDGAEPTLQGDQVTHVLSAETRAIVQRLPRELHAPEAVVLLAAFYLLLAAHGAGPDITVGSPMSVRPREAPRTVGHHTNVLPLLVRVDPAESFRMLVRRSRDTFFGALSHVDVPVDSIPDLVPRAGSSWRNRLCRHLFNYFPQLGLPDFEMSGLRARPLLVDNGYSKFDLEFFVASSADSIRIIARYCRDKLDESDAEALLCRYEALLVQLGESMDQPTGELAVWSDKDRAVIETANDTAMPLHPTNVAEAVHGHVRAAPEAVAVQHGDRSVSYRQLWNAAVATRDVLVKSGVCRGDIVAIAAARTPELLAAVLGVWLTGAAYLPVDPEHPAQRVTYLLADSGAKVVLTDRDLPLPADQDTVKLLLEPVTSASSGEPLGGFPLRIDPEDCAYLIYTSGSTGRPKGALIPHRSVANIAADYIERLGATAADATLWMTTFAFDMANLEVYVPLYSGGRVVIAPDEARVDGRVLLDMIELYQPGIIQATPTTWRLVLDQVADHLKERRIIVGAETVPVTLARQLVATGCEVHHAYGPTETTTWATWSVLPADVGDRLDIGHPIWNTQVMVAGPDGRELPIGVRGELWIAGHGVALGYHRRPELTTQRFGEHPVHGRYYRTGDIGRWRADGTLELLGRADRQIKLRGNRIELGEVEATLLDHPLVKAAAVIVVGDGGTDGRLVAFVEATVDTDISGDLWEYTRAELPRSAIPQQFTVLDALPTNTNEKIDYVALEGLAASGRFGPSAADAGAGPADEVVQDLMELYRGFLDRDDVTPQTNFFTHGGHSLLGAQLLQRIEETTGIAVKLADLFAAPTPDGLAEFIRVG